MGRRLLVMIVKEFGQLLRDWPVLFIVFWAFSGGILVAGRAVNMEPVDYPVAVLDFSHSAESRELIARLRPPSFKIVRMVHSDRDLVRVMDEGEASVAVVIPADFARAVAQGHGQFQVILDGSQSLMASVAAAYIARIAGDLDVALMERQAAKGGGGPLVEPRIRVAYNPNLDSAWFSSLLELFNMITMVAMLLSAAALMREKERGTLEQLLVSPLRPAEIFVAKLVPTVVMILLVSPIAIFGVIHGVFHTPLRGSLLLFYGVSILYILSVASLGLAIAVVTRNLPQATMTLFLILLPMLFLSGAFTPPEAMAPWMRYLTLISPMRYYIDFGYGVLFKGNGLAIVWPDLLGILSIGSVFFAFSVWRFRRLFS